MDDTITEIKLLQRAFAPVHNLIEKFGADGAVLLLQLTQFCDLQSGFITLEQPEIAARLNVSRTTLQRGIRHLIERGALQVVRTGRANVYALGPNVREDMLCQVRSITGSEIRAAAEPRIFTRGRATGSSNPSSYPQHQRAGDGGGRSLCRARDLTAEQNEHLTAVCRRAVGLGTNPRVWKIFIERDPRWINHIVNDWVKDRARGGENAPGIGALITRLDDSTGMAAWCDQQRRKAEAAQRDVQRDYGQRHEPETRPDTNEINRMRDAIRERVGGQRNHGAPPKEITSCSQDVRPTPANQQPRSFSPASTPWTCRTRSAPGVLSVASVFATAKTSEDASEFST